MRYHVVLDEQQLAAIQTVIPDLPVNWGLHRNGRPTYAALLSDLDNVTVSPELPTGQKWVAYPNVLKGFKAAQIRQLAATYPAVWVRVKRGQSARVWVKE